ncbi:MAG: hypothetical protein IJE48_00220 [Clostridia bacterium]|nr:hypothetical protein [Clostridia bacterium]
MTKSNKYFTLLHRAVASMLCICIALGMLCSCSKTEESGIKTVKSVVSRNTISSPAEDATIHYSKSSKSFGTKAATSGLIELYVDPETNTFCVFETTKGKLWSVLPLLDGVASGEELVSNASMVSLEIIGGTDVYLLNSQDNSVAYGKASHSLIENGVVFIYDIFANADTSTKEKYEKTDIGFRVTVTVTLNDGSMNISVIHANLTGNPDAYIENIELLNCFGAYNASGVDDFLLVPDGSGAVIKTAIYDESFEDLSFAVYGDDPSAHYETSGNAIIPAFGIKHGDSAFVSLIQKGDAVATINACKAKSLSEYNTVYPSFRITPVFYEDETLSISKSSAASEISLCYRFLSGNNATYSGLASACREQLIRNSVLSTKTVDVDDYLPFFLTLTGAAKKSAGPLKYLSTLTDFEQAKDMLIRMKNKGINDVNVRYSGIFSGGLDSKDIDGASVLMRLGGTEKLNELYEYISSQKMSLYLDINLLSSSKGFASGNALNIHKANSSYTPVSRLAQHMETEASPREFRSLNKLSKLVASVLRDTRYYGFTGYCINDVGSVLYSDFSSGGLLRDAASDEIAAAIAPLSTGHSTMADTGNFYMLKNVDSVINIPINTTVSQSGAYFSIPFVQLVLHGIVDYAGYPINTGINLNETLLKYIEYGACPHFEWNYEALSGQTKNDPFYYDNTINAAAEFYSQANETLNDLRDARMTDHYEVDDGVFCTEYDTGSMIYVNYTDSDFSTLGVVVEARSFLRVN